MDEITPFSLGNGPEKHETSRMVKKKWGTQPTSVLASQMEELWELANSTSETEDHQGLQPSVLAKTASVPHEYSQLVQDELIKDILFGIYGEN